MSEPVWTLKPDADEETRERFNATTLWMGMNYGNLMIRIDSDGTRTLITPPEFVKISDDELPSVLHMPVNLGAWEER